MYKAIVAVLRSLNLLFNF